MTVTTSSGKIFEADLVVENLNPERLYINVIGSTVAAVAQAFTTELPLQEYPDYTVFDSMNITPRGGVTVCLKKS